MIFGSLSKENLVVSDHSGIIKKVHRRVRSKAEKEIISKYEMCKAQCRGVDYIVSNKTRWAKDYYHILESRQFLSNRNSSILIF